MLTGLLVGDLTMPVEKDDKEKEDRDSELSCRSSKPIICNFDDDCAVGPFGEVILEC